MIRFTANVSILFTEWPFLSRFGRAREAGFEAVEFWWPRGVDPNDIERAVRDADLTVTGMNFDAGNMPGGERGLLCDPARTAEFRAHVPIALELAESLGCGMMNALIGHRRPDLRRADQLALARDNVAWLADQARPHDVTVLIEALNTFENGPYLLDDTRSAVSFIRSVGRDNVRLQFDVYHMQRMEGNLTSNLREHIAQIAHIQIADSPGRGEPGTGEINFQFLLAEINRLAYSGYIGLEYKPSEADTLKSLEWLPPDGRSRPIRPEDLQLP